MNKPNLHTKTFDLEASLKKLNEIIAVPETTVNKEIERYAKIKELLIDVNQQGYEAGFMDSEDLNEMVTKV